MAGHRGPASNCVLTMWDDGLLWQQLCSYFGLNGRHHTDNIVHVLASYPSLDEAWAWTRKTLACAGLAYEGSRATFWLYGDVSLLQHRVTKRSEGPFLRRTPLHTHGVYTPRRQRRCDRVTLGCHTSVRRCNDRLRAAGTMCPTLSPARMTRASSSHGDRSPQKY